ncbi:MAG: Bax inhibitor-1/YccA family protein [Bacteroidia bacterium]|jgi:uncharacterized YccA/Bax inhibitor family protein|nr:Bax inhibitor-1/YccA family protein [Bacteroidia bacterium]
MSSPLFSEKAFSATRSGSYEGSMTLKGTVDKSIVLFLTLLAPAVWIWNKMGGDPEYAINNGVQTYMYGGLIIGLISILIMSFKKSWSPYLAPVYAAAEGVLLGALSMFFEAMFPGIVMQAVAITMGIFALMLVLYKTNVLRATPMFTKVIYIATAGVGIFYLLMMVLNLFGVHGLSNFYAGSSPMSIGLSVLIAGIAAFNLIMDFTFIEEASNAGAPKYMEWYAGVGLLATLIWLYIEILRLLAKLQSRD